MKVVARRDADDGVGMPDRIDSSPPVHARLVGYAPPPPTLREGIQEESAEVVAILDPSDEIGVHRGLIEFRWNDGQRETRDISWEVVPYVQVYPSTLFLREGEPTTKSVTIRSACGPIRILGATGPFQVNSLLASGVACDVHEITLDLLVPLGASGPKPIVRIATNCKQQPSVDVSLMLAPAQSKEEVNR